MKSYKIILRSFLLLFFLVQSCAKPQERIHTSFNQNWQFNKGEVGQEQLPEFDTSNWRTLNLPHDWAIEGPFDEANDARTGGLPIYGTAWYRKTFTIEAAQEGNQILIEFDGVMNNAEIFINGNKAF